MDEQQKEDFGDTTFVEGMVEAVDDIATAMIAMRRQLIQAGFDSQMAEGAALQHQSFTNSMILERIKQDRPRGLFG